MLKTGQHQKTRIIFQNVDGAIALMGIKIKNGDAMQVMHFGRTQGGDGNIIEKTKSHTFTVFSMVGRGKYGEKDINEVILHQLIEIHGASTNGITTTVKTDDRRSDVLED